MDQVEVSDMDLQDVDKVMKDSQQVMAELPLSMYRLVLNLVLSNVL